MQASGSKGTKASLWEACLLCLALLRSEFEFTRLQVQASLPHLKICFLSLNMCPP